MITSLRLAKKDELNSKRLNKSFKIDTDSTLDILLIKWLPVRIVLIVNNKMTVITGNLNLRKETFLIILPWRLFGNSISGSSFIVFSIWSFIKLF